MFCITSQRSNRMLTAFMFELLARLSEALVVRFKIRNLERSQDFRTPTCNLNGAEHQELYRFRDPDMISTICSNISEKPGVGTSVVLY